VFCEKFEPIVDSLYQSQGLFLQPFFKPVDRFVSLDEQFHVGDDSRVDGSTRVPEVVFTTIEQGDPIEPHVLDAPKYLLRFTVPVQGKFVLDINQNAGRINARLLKPEQIGTFIQIYAFIIADRDGGRCLSGGSCSHFAGMQPVFDEVFRICGGFPFPKFKHGIFVVFDRWVWPKSFQ